MCIKRCIYVCMYKDATTQEKKIAIVNTVDMKKFVNYK